MFEPGKLKEFDLVIMVNTTGDLFRPKKLPEDKAISLKEIDLIVPRVFLVVL